MNFKKIADTSFKQLRNEERWIAKMRDSQKRIIKKKKLNYKKKKLKGRYIYCKIDLTNFKKRLSLLEKGLKQIAKMQNLSQNELNQITKMHNQSRDELERIAKNQKLQQNVERRVNKSQHSIAELFYNNLDNGKINDIKRIRNRLGDILPKEYRKEIKKKLYEIKK